MIANTIGGFGWLCDRCRKDTVEPGTHYCISCHWDLGRAVAPPIPESSASVAPRRWAVGDLVWIEDERKVPVHGRVVELEPNDRVRIQCRRVLDGCSQMWDWSGPDDWDGMWPRIDERGLMKAEPPLTVTAEHICPQQFVMDMTDVIHAHECKAHGSEQFERLASDLEQVRVLARANWIASLPLPIENEAPGDYARRVGIKPCKNPKNGALFIRWELAVLQVMDEVVDCHG